MAGVFLRDGSFRWLERLSIMRHLTTARLLPALLISALSLSGCIPLVVGAGATGAVAAAQDRGLEQGVNDNEIAFEINRRLADKNGDLFRRVSTQVNRGRVVLIGTVARTEDRLTVVEISRKVDGVKQVIDELQVGQPLSFSENTDDTVITTKLRGEITGDSKISSINYSIDTVRGTVYLMGIAQNQSELDRVIAHARGVSGVRNVVSNVEVKSSITQQ
ncbi:BON domain-containing protein [Parvibaculum sedimenti]|uniref:BON domain-containing protein n=2 Tax=Parvibaculum sedimenti TaxID=2608632 RepID=A0A6N6VMW1_9HYPH|nr:BON domain-containing protein [Parvibaculum sedimenti]